MISKKIHFLLIAVIIFSISIRLYKLHERGVFNYDEAYYLLQGQFVESSLINFKDITAAVKQGFGLKQVYDRYIKGTFLSTPKILVPPAVALAGLITGGVDDSTINYISAVFNILTYVLLCLYIYRNFGLNTALFFAAILGTMAYDIIYARSSYPEALPEFLYFVSVLTYFRWREQRSLKYIIIISILLSISFTYNYRFAVPYFFLFSFAFIEAVINKWKLKDIISLTAVPALMLMAALFVCELPYIFLKYKGLFQENTYNSLGGGIKIMTYWGLLLKSFGGKAGTIKDTVMFSVYHFRSLWLFTGPLVIILSFLGIRKIDLSERKTAFTAYMTLMTYASVIFFSYGSLSGRPRSIIFCLPGIALLAALGAEKIICRLNTFLPKKNIAIIQYSAVLLLIVNGLHGTYGILKLRSHFKEAYSKLNTIMSPEEKHFTTIWPMSAFYLGRNRSLYPVPSKIEELREYLDKGVRYLLVDGNYSFVLSENIRQRLLDVEPVLKVYNPDSMHISNLGRRRAETLLRIKDEPEIMYIRIFDIKDIVG